MDTVHEQLMVRVPPASALVMFGTVMAKAATGQAFPLRLATNHPMEATIEATRLTLMADGVVVAERGRTTPVR